jgi:acyl-CoA dehydrogenase
VTLALIALSLILFAVLAMRESPLWQWALAALVIGLLTRVDVTANGLTVATDLGGLVLVLLPAIIFGLLSVTPIRKLVLMTPVYGAAGMRSFFPAGRTGTS